MTRMYDKLLYMDPSSHFG